jgi:hypothetical protein
MFNRYKNTMLDKKQVLIQCEIYIEVAFAYLVY